MTGLKDATCISILLPDLRGGGAERVNLDLAHEFARLGYAVEFILMRVEGELLSEAAENFSIFDLATPRARNVLPGLVKYLREKRPAALLAAMWPLTAIAPIAARLTGFKGSVVISEHGLLSVQYAGHGRLHRLFIRASMRIGYRLADARVGVSQGVVVDMAKLAAMPISSFQAIYNPVRRLSSTNSDVSTPVSAIWGKNSKRILTVGNLKAVKNHQLLLHAFARLSSKTSTLMLLGQGEREAALRTLTAELGITDRVIFAGFHADPSPFYATADLFVLSSDNEGFGNVIVEALSFGLPVVSTNCPVGPAEILQNGRWGKLVPVGDVVALTLAMERALSMPVDKVALKRRAADFSPEIAARKYIELLGLK